MDEQSFKEVNKDIQYVNVNPTLFQMPYDDIKSDKSCARTGEYIYFVVNETCSCGFTISPFINSDLTISTLHHCTIY